MESLRLPAVSFAYMFQQTRSPPWPVVSIDPTQSSDVPVSVQVLVTHEPVAFVLKIDVSSAMLSAHIADAVTLVPSVTEPPELSETVEYVGLVMSSTLKQWLGMVVL